MVGYSDALIPKVIFILWIDIEIWKRLRKHIFIFYIPWDFSTPEILKVFNVTTGSHHWWYDATTVRLVSVKKILIIFLMSKVLFFLRFYTYMINVNLNSTNTILNFSLKFIRNISSFLVSQGYFDTKAYPIISEQRIVGK